MILLRRYHFRKSLLLPNDTAHRLYFKEQPDAPGSRPTCPSDRRGTVRDKRVYTLSSHQ